MAYSFTSVDRGEKQEQQQAPGVEGGGGSTGAQRPIQLPFAGLPTQRGTGTGDQRYINVIVEKESNALTGGDFLVLRKRPGVQTVNQPPGAAATGRGIFAWDKTGAIYSVFGNALYKGASAMTGGTLATSTGKVWWATTPATATTQYLVMSDGTDMYLIESDDTVTQIDTTDDAEWPAANLGPVLFFDDYIFLAQSTGEIWNSDVDAPASWTSTGVISAGGYGDPLECIVRMKEQIVAMGKSSIQMFYDNGTTGSPLARVEQNAFQVGLSHKNTVGQSGETLIWVGEATDGKDLNRQVWIMEGLTKIKTISTKVVERFLAAEGSNISSATCFMERVDGHMLYVINLFSANRTFVYDVEMDFWVEWQVAGAATKITWVDACSLNGVVYLQHATDGYVYKFVPTLYQDNGTNFTVTVQTQKYNFAAPQAKFQSGLWVECDTTSASSNLGVAVSDDDYTTWSTTRNIDLSDDRKFLPQLGRFYERAYKFTYTDNYPLRLTNFYIAIELGDM